MNFIRGRNDANDASSTARSDRTQSPEMVVLDNVSFQYPQASHEVCHEMNLTVPRGQFVCIVGPSGCGKSTLLRLFAGLLHPTSGDVRVDGQRISGPTDSIAVVFQSDTLLPWRSAVKNVQLGIEGRMDRADLRTRSIEMLRIVGLSGAESKYPHQLSGGMRQRVNLARALVVDPEVLLLDEPFAALDAQTREAQQENLLSVWSTQKKTVIFVTHDIDEAVFLADRVVVVGPSPNGIISDSLLPLGRPRSLDVKATDAFRLEVQRIREVILSSGGGR